MKKNNIDILSTNTGYKNTLSCREKRQLSVYIHIPFCVKKCLYCDFLSMESSEEMRENYVQALLMEIELESENYKDYKISTIFLGGGTPSLLTPLQLNNVLCKLKNRLDISEEAEITMEINPGTVTRETLEAFFESGVNRLSIGLQSANDQELKKLGRIHNFQDFLSSYHWAKEVGFTNINVDLISSLPDQTVEDYEKSLMALMELNPRPQHISAYSLIIEEGTPFFDMYTEMEEEQDRNLYELTEKILKNYGYHRYEISNYALKNKECLHNITYWKRKEYVGFGIGAASLINETRWCNTRKIDRYLSVLNNQKLKGSTHGLWKNEEEPLEILSEKDRMEEFMFLGLRMMEGICKKDFYLNFDVSIEVVYGETLKKLEAEKLLVNGEKVLLTKRGIDLSNYVFGKFML